MKIAFNTANLVGRVTGYRFAMADWGVQHEKTAAAMSEREWGAICAEIAAAGFTAVEVWLAHADPSVTDEARARSFRRILDEHGLAPIGLAGAFSDTSARICQWMGIGSVNGGLWGTSLEDVRRIVAATGVRWNYENHPERSVDEIRARIDSHDSATGICVDTGWLGTQGMDAAEAIRSLGPLVRHVHLKDVRRRGSHETCPLGEGCVGIRQVIAALRGAGYEGWYSWEDEPEARNPMEIAARMRSLIEEELRSIS